MDLGLVHMYRGNFFKHFFKKVLTIPHPYTHTHTHVRPGNITNKHKVTLAHKRPGKKMEKTHNYGTTQERGDICGVTNGV